MSGTSSTSSGEQSGTGREADNATSTLAVVGPLTDGSVPEATANFDSSLLQDLPVTRLVYALYIEDNDGTSTAADEPVPPSGWVQLAYAFKKAANKGNRGEATETDHTMADDVIGMIASLIHNTLKFVKGEGQESSLDTVIQKVLDRSSGKLSTLNIHRYTGAQQEDFWSVVRKNLPPNDDTTYEGSVAQEVGGLWGNSAFGMYRVPYEREPDSDSDGHVYDDVSRSDKTV
ncbi:hypothetical protein TREMEDRAFT_58576 [Tremella mesenterica DSM 1558]|uniref:uncharacterized protein n=1 Tax=Tremella mesenterica (strain ATCC 24925 / CBS 8224 / DSM 1558 / NBRC 9311 / NRRL Y-6157 / RJB 2259-6 / UBC 559-6) TaxID=578456 RepID=UPI0003F493E1|nr:uncharacterized protein TREMEDRAFT_58576 [Tremella mesenterica DSM 1558]EIW72413.1 hypothetical protein TREMEDRAFT_58576 [Tremella mesenterica DSM 1558]